MAHHRVLLYSDRTHRLHRAHIGFFCAVNLLSLAAASVFLVLDSDRLQVRSLLSGGVSLHWRPGVNVFASQATECFFYEDWVYFIVQLVVSCCHAAQNMLSTANPPGHIACSSTLVR